MESLLEKNSHEEKRLKHADISVQQREVRAYSERKDGVKQKAGKKESKSPASMEIFNMLKKIQTFTKVWKNCDGDSLSSIYFI